MKNKEINFNKRGALKMAFQGSLVMRQVLPPKAGTGPDAKYM
jgi:hypothetical protein